MLGLKRLCVKGQEVKHILNNKNGSRSVGEQGLIMWNISNLKLHDVPPKSWTG